MASPLELLFRVVYGVFYTFLHLLLVALLLVTPGDIINQSRIRGNLYPILIVAACYVASILIVVFVYFARLYINRSILNAIPKSWIPIEKGDVRKHVRKMIAAGLSRSAAVAFVSRPRVLPEALLTNGRSAHAEPLMSGGVKGADKVEAPGAPDAGSKQNVTRKAVRFTQKAETAEKEKELGIDLPPCRAVWGAIEHPGWAPPAQPKDGDPLSVAGGEILDLQYSAVVAELPNLVEAKALTLAPPDPNSHIDPPLLDPQAVALLQRPAAMGLRAYLAHLAELGVLPLHSRGLGQDGDKVGDDEKEELHQVDSDDRALGAVVASFAAAYERARFSTRMLSHAAFRQLMHDLATILRRMAPLDPGVLADDGDYYSDDNDDDDSSAYSGDKSSIIPGGGVESFADDDGGADSEGDIDNNAARSAPTTPSSRSRSRESRINMQQQQQQLSATSQQLEQLRDAASRSTGRSRSTSTGRSHATAASSGSSGSSSSSSQGSNGTSRRHRRRRHHNTAPSTSQQSVSRSLAGTESASTSRRGASQTTGLKPPKVRNAPRTSARASASRNPPASLSRSSSANSFAQSRQPYTVGGDDGQPSSSSSSSRGAGSGAASLRSAASSGSSGSSGSTGSVIRLADRGEQQALGLPYVLMSSQGEPRGLT